MVAGSVRGLYTPRISKNRPSRGDSLSAATTRYVGWPRRPIRRNRMRTILFPAPCRYLFPSQANESQRAGTTAAYFTREYPTTLNSRIIPWLRKSFDQPNHWGDPLPPDFFILAINFSASRNCLINRFTSWTSTPEPAAMRRRREAFKRSGFRRSCIVMD